MFFRFYIANTCIYPRIMTERCMLCAHINEIRLECHNKKNVPTKIFTNSQRTKLLLNYKLHCSFVIRSREWKHASFEPLSFEVCHILYISCYLCWLRFWNNQLKIILEQQIVKRSWHLLRFIYKIDNIFAITFAKRLFCTPRVYSNRHDRNGWLQLLIFVSVSEIPDTVIANIPAGLSGACVNAALIENRNSAIFSRPTLGIWLKSLRIFVYTRSEHTDFLFRFYGM